MTSISAVPRVHLGIRLLHSDIFPVADCTHILVNAQSSYNSLSFGFPLLWLAIRPTDVSAFQNGVTS